MDYRSESRLFRGPSNVAKIEFVIHRLENKSSSAWDDCIQALRNTYNNQVEDGSGDYETTVDKGGSTTESHLIDTYSPNVSNPDVYDLHDDWGQYVDDNLSTTKWRVHGLVVDWHEMNGDDTGYDVSGAGGLAVGGSANHLGGSHFWASNPRGTVHEATHTMLDEAHYDHNMGREDVEGDTTAMGAVEGEGCSDIDYLEQPDIESGTTDLGVRTINAVRKFRDDQTYISGLPDCCYYTDDTPCNPP